MGSSGTCPLARFGGDQFAGGDQAFFVGQAESLAGADGFVGRLQARDSDDRADHEIHFRMSGNAHGSGCAVNDFNIAEAVAFQPSPQRIRIRLLCHRDHARPPAARLLECSVNDC